MSLMIRDLSELFQNMSGMPASMRKGKLSGGVSINSKSGQAMLSKYGIDTISKRYKAAMKMISKSMAVNGGGVAYTNPEAIRNVMNMFDEDGDIKDPVTGLSGLNVTDENISEKKRIISIPESNRQEMFDVTKREFIAGNGNYSGELTKRSDVYTNLYRNTVKKDRLAAGNTMQQYEQAYTRALENAVREVQPDWKPGKFLSGEAVSAAQKVTREDVESSMSLYGIDTKA